MTRTTRPTLLLGSALLLSLPATASSQSTDFLFKQPILTLAVSGGWSMPGEGSDVFEFTREHLTVGEGDFSSPALMLEAGIRLTERLDVTVGYELASRTVDSEMRDWVTMDDQPIVQSTEFSRQRGTLSLKGYLLPRGRRISQLAWIPNRWAPYLGAGAGLSWYEFEQYGDFVDVETLDIFEDRFRADGRGGTWHAMAGLDVTLTPHFLLRGEYRYVGGEGRFVSSDFDGFDDTIDLSGSQVTLGVAVRM